MHVSICFYTKIPPKRIRNVKKSIEFKFFKFFFSNICAVCSLTAIVRRENVRNIYILRRNKRNVKRIEFDVMFFYDAHKKDGVCCSNALHQQINLSKYTFRTNI